MRDRLVNPRLLYAVPSQYAAEGPTLHKVHLGRAIETTLLLLRSVQLPIEPAQLLLQVASPVQAARCLVQSFPWYPDTLCILTWIAAEAGDSKAMELLEQKTMSAVDSHQGSDQGSAGDLSPSMSPA